MAHLFDQIRNVWRRAFTKSGDTPRVAPQVGALNVAIDDDDIDDDDDGYAAVPKEWLDERKQVHECEVQYSIDGVPFGGLNDKWKALREYLVAEDEIWTFCSPPKSWEARAGRAGIAIVRGGKVTRSLVTLMN